MKTEPYSVEASISIYHVGKLFIGYEQIKLIRQIIVDGSINAAAQHLGYSYQKTWQMVNQLNLISPKLIVISKRGGQNGGGCIISDYGKQIYKLYVERELEIYKILSQSGDNGFDEFL